jgi:tight adherence protein B
MVQITTKGLATLIREKFIEGMLVSESSLGIPFASISSSILSAPLVTGLLAASLALLGWIKVGDEAVYRFYGRRKLARYSKSAGTLRNNSIFNPVRGGTSTSAQIIQVFIAFGSTLVVSILMTTSLEISLAISLLLAGIPFVFAKRKAERFRVAQDKAWPVAIDEIVASLQAGKSITEAVTGLTMRGPSQLKVVFQRLELGLRAGRDFEVLLIEEMLRLDSAITDQTLTTLLFAKEFGGREVITTLRMLSTFLREESKVREEIDTKFGWVRNSAILGAVAPWLLLTLLSTQRSTVEAYQSDAGVLILSLGVVLTALAFIWMERVSRIPKPPRPLKPRYKWQSSSDGILFSLRNGEL